VTTTTEERTSAVAEGTEEGAKDDTNGGGNGKKEYVADCPEPAFHLGCYMALGEEIHQMAHHGSNTMQSSVAGVCETPRKLLPGVILKIRHALVKLNRVDDEVAADKFQIASEATFYTFSSAWKEGCPTHLSDEEQFQFWRGYSYQKYMVRQWKKKPSKDNKGDKNGKGSK
jgi:hypothetical protein